MVFVCPLCYRSASTRMKGLIRHIGIVHSQQPNFHIVCGISGCPRTYNNFLSYKKHVYKKHKLYLDIEDGNHQDVVLNSEDDIHVDLFQHDHPEIPETSSTSTGTCAPQDGKSCAALTLLKGCHSIQKTVYDYVYDIPLCQSLQSLLRNEFIKDEVSYYKTS